MIEVKIRLLLKSPNGLRALNSGGMQQFCEATALQVASCKQLNMSENGP
jgi:hypothetical protein